MRRRILPDTQLRAAVRRRLAPARLLIVGLLPGLVGAACGLDYAGLAGTRVDGGPATQDASLFATDGSGPPPAPTGSAGTGGSFLAPRRGGGAGAGSDGATTVGGGGASGGSGGGGGTGAFETGGAGKSGAAGGGMNPGGADGARSGSAGGSSAGGASSGVGGMSQRPAPNGGTSGSSGDLVLHYEFEEADGFVTADSSGYAGGPHNAVLRVAGNGGGSGFSNDHRAGSHALALRNSGAMNGGFVTVPPIGQLAPDAMTVAVWVKIASSPPWQRVLDCGGGMDRYFFLTTGEANSFVRFAVTQSGPPGEQGITSNVRLTPGSWHHLAIVLESGLPYSATLYVNGVAAGTNPAMTLRPGNLGATASNYLGRSQFDADFTFDGLLDDFRVYRRALTPAEIAMLFEAP